MNEFCVASLLHPRIHSTLFVEPPASDAAGCAPDVDGTRAVQIAGAGEVNDSIVVVARVAGIVLSGAIGIEDHARVASFDGCARVKYDWRRAGTEGCAIGTGVGKTGLHRELNVARQRVSATVTGAGETAGGGTYPQYWTVMVP